MDDFRKKILKVNSTRKHKINNSLGVYDAYKWLRKNRWLDVGRISEHDYYSIIRAINKEIIKHFLHRSGEILLPCRMGVFKLRKYYPIIKLKKGKLYTTLPIDWDKTLQLWENDKASRHNKTLIRKETREVFTVIYDKSKAIYSNKSFYSFTPNRHFKQEIKDAIDNNNLDAFILCGKI